MEEFISCNIVFTVILTITELLTIISPNVHATTDIRVAASLVPSHQVEIGAVFAVHCQVWNLEEGQRVELFKVANQRSYPLSVGQSVVEPDERVLLAIRHMSDSSVVHFLTITDVSVSDEAQYSCKVIETFPELSEVATDTVNLELMYFPSHSFPVCDPMEPLPDLKEGEIISLSCHSERGNPTVAIAWKKGSHTYYDTEKTTTNGIIYANLDVKVKASDHGAVFLCEISSDVFPGMKQTCHIGPLTVTPDPNSPAIFESSTAAIKLTDTIKTSGGNTKVDSLEDCQKECRPTDSPIIYWVVTTIVASVLALIFFIVGVTLLLKICRSSEGNSPDYHEPRLDGAGRIYREIESRRDGGKTYMSLVKPYSESDIMPQVPEKFQTRTSLGD